MTPLWIINTTKTLLKIQVVPKQNTRTLVEGEGEVLHRYPLILPIQIERKNTWSIMRSGVAPIVKAAPTINDYGTKMPPPMTLLFPSFPRHLHMLEKMQTTTRRILHKSCKTTIMPLTTDAVPCLSSLSVANTSFFHFVLSGF